MQHTLTFPPNELGTNFVILN